MRGITSDHTLLSFRLNGIIGISKYPLVRQVEIINKKFNCSISMSDLISFYEIESNNMEHVVFNGYI